MIFTFCQVLLQHCYGYFSLLLLQLSGPVIGNLAIKVPKDSLQLGVESASIFLQHFSPEWIAG
eukprot:m.222212 g.222212  ORF g.222212 m.222212 type:complete len:63 (+) comp22301_c0_seq12:560-748(+)